MEEFEFEVLAGKHSDAAGNVYKKGDIIKTSLDLSGFRNKFRRIIREAVAKVVEEGQEVLKDLVSEGSKELIDKLNETPAEPEKTEPEKTEPETKVETVSTVKKAKTK